MLLLIKVYKLKKNLIVAFTGKFLRTEKYNGSACASVLHRIISSQRLGGHSETILYLPSFCDVPLSLKTGCTKDEWESSLTPDCSTYIFHSSDIFAGDKWSGEVRTPKGVVIQDSFKRNYWSNMEKMQGQLNYLRINPWGKVMKMRGMQNQTTKRRFKKKNRKPVSKALHEMV